MVIVIEGQEGVTWDDWRNLAEVCEGRNMGGLFTSDHYLAEAEPAERPVLDAWSVLSGLAAITHTLRLGTIVTPITFRHPAVLAKVAVTVDHLSGGRVELGLGAGWYEEEHLAYGFNFPPLRERLRLLGEYGEIIRGLTSTGPFQHSGAAYRLIDAPGLPKPIQHALPIIVGGTGKSGTTRCAAAFGDEYNSLETSIEACSRVRTSLDEACRAIERDPATLPMSVSLKCVTGSTERDVQLRLERAFGLMLSTAPEARPTLDEGWLVGVPDEISFHLHRLEKAGVRRVFLRFVDHRDLEAIEVLGTEVRDALKREGE